MSKIEDKYGNPIILDALDVESKSERKDPVEQLREAIAEAGLLPPEKILLDGKFHRFRDRADDKPTDKAGWYIAHSNGIPAGAFGSWHGFQHSFPWRAKINRNVNETEERQIRDDITRAIVIHKQEKDRLARLAAENCEYIWDHSSYAIDDHPYLVLKGIRHHGTRVTGDGRLIVPIYDINDKLRSLQYISSVTENGKTDKKYHLGGNITGNHWVLGDDLGAAEKIYIAEGFATAATIYEVTDCPTVVAYSAQNIVPVLKALKERYPAGHFVIVADNDATRTGERYAEQAAALYGATVIVMPTVGQDANDYHLAGGDLNTLLNPVSKEWLVPVKVFADKPQPVSWLIRRWVQSKALVMIHGPSGCGKTFIVLDWSLRLAAGVEDWQGQRVRPGPVVYLAGEGHHGLKSRVAAWMKHHKKDDARMWVSNAGCDMNTPTGLQKILENISALEEPPCMIVVDTLHRFLLGDENSAEDTKTMLDACAILMLKFDCTVVLVHHTGVSEEAQHRARGSSAWRGAVDIELSVAKKVDGPIEVTQRKAKDSDVMEPIYLALERVELPEWEDDEGEPMASCVVVSSGAPPSPPTRRETKLEGFRRLFERAWESSSKDVGQTGAPWLSRTQLRAFLESNGMAKVAANNAMNVTRTYGMMGALVGAGLITSSINMGVEGFLVMNNTDASSIILGNV